METYLVIITTALVLAEIVRLIQNALATKELKNIYANNERVSQYLENCSRAALTYLMDREQNYQILTQVKGRAQELLDAIKVENARKTRLADRLDNKGGA